MPESPTVLSPAEQAAEEALGRVFHCLDSGTSFILEAGAGAGKTHSLVQALKHVLEERAEDMVRRGQKVACITYTNVASEEIDSRTGQHPAVHSSTIHALCWSLIGEFQQALRKELPALGKWAERLEEKGGIDGLPIEYDLGYPNVRDGRVYLGHSDIVPLTVRLLENEKFRRVFAARYPVVFIDEYQDTSKDFVEALKKHFLDSAGGPLLGFFGDRWQKIYGDGCGAVEHDALETIDKGANFRSAPAVVNLLNAMRPDLPQAIRDPDAEGSVGFYHANDWEGERRVDGHFKGDLPAKAVSDHMKRLMESLKDEGWDMGASKLKILMLTHRGLAAEQGYARVVDAFGRNEAWTNKEDPLVKFFADALEPAHEAFLQKKYGQMFLALGRRSPTIRRASDKKEWHESFQRLTDLRGSGTIGDVLSHLYATGRPRLPETLHTRWEALQESDEGQPDPNEPPSVALLRKLSLIPYGEMAALTRFLNQSTPFETQHGVKGAEFDNVIVVCGRGWNNYDFNGMLEWWPDKAPRNKQDMYERTRNLFYVACSRPKKRLAVLFTQQLSDEAITTLECWAGEGSVRSF